MSKMVCSNCGHEAKENETFITFLNSNTEWWLQLFNGDALRYCQKCADKKRIKNKTIKDDKHIE
jgi:hypothetical protein